MDNTVSVVSLVKERTVSYLKCHTRGFEKVIWPIICICFLVLSILLLAVACGTQNWVQLEVRNNTEHRGTITFGLVRGTHSIRYRERPISSFINDSYFLVDKLPLSYLARIHTTFAFSIAAILLCLLNVLVTLVNTYQSVTTWWKGPTMIYLLSLFAGLFGMVAVGVFMDYYLWELDTSRVFINITTLAQSEALTLGNLTFTSFEYLISEEGYNFVPSFQYSFFLEIAGACLPLVVVLLAWRLALLAPPRKIDLGVEKNNKNIMFEETDQFMREQTAVVTSVPVFAPDEEPETPLTSSPSQTHQVDMRRPSLTTSPVKLQQKDVLY